MCGRLIFYSFKGGGSCMPKTASKQVHIRFAPDATLEPQRIYSNYVEVNHTPNDFSLKFCDAEPINIDVLAGRKEYEHRIPVVAHIAVPVRLLPAIINALSVQLKSYETAYGKVDSAPEKKDKQNNSPSQ